MASEREAQIVSQREGQGRGREDGEQPDRGDRRGRAALPCAREGLELRVVGVLREVRERHAGLVRPGRRDRFVGRGMGGRGGGHDGFDRAPSAEFPNRTTAVVRSLFPVDLCVVWYRRRPKSFTRRMTA